MSYLSTLQNDMKVAMKAKDSVRLNTIRMLISQMKNAAIDAREELTPEQELAVLSSAAKKRKESIEIYEKSNRSDLLEKERQELSIIETYLPAQMSDAEIEKVITEIAAELGASSMKDLGKLMGESMKQLKGKADGKKVQDIARRKLA
ncbi:GatB/YqeY domain-containing protein [candidate division KSB1 bacterium]|nr:GatB/YqeY domain-containing protein [candidate division KSB1 bacterium]